MRLSNQCPQCASTNSPHIITTLGATIYRCTAARGRRLEHENQDRAVRWEQCGTMYSASGVLKPAEVLPYKTFDNPEKSELFSRRIPVLAWAKAPEAA